MAKMILQINFNFNISKVEYEQAVESLAPVLALFSGLLWKIWILNEAEREAGGIYLFEDETSLQAFLEGPLAAQVKGHPAFDDLTAKQFEVMTNATATTRGPV